LAVPLVDATLETDVLGKGKGKGVIRQKMGEPVWVEGGYSHTLKNAGTTRARWVQIEIK
jgi:hypothetical protein